MSDMDKLRQMAQEHHDMKKEIRKLRRTERRYLKSYEHRNLAVCNGFGIKAGLDLCYRRMSARRDCPQWLKDQLADLLIRSNKSIEALVEYRALR